MRRRILRLAVITSLITLLLFGLPLAAAVRLAYAADERSELTRLAERAAATVSADGLRGVDPVELPAAEPGVSLGAYDGAGRLVAGAGPATADAGARAALAGGFAERSGPGWIQVAVPIRAGEAVLGVLRARSSTRAATRRTWLTWAGMVGLGGVAVALAALLARRQAGRLAMPMVRLAATAAGIGDGGPPVRGERSGITEIDAVAAALEATAVRLAEVLDRERAFSANASHQLRTPLTGLRLTLEAALAGDDAGLRAAAVRAVDATDRLERIIDELLVIARGDAADRGELDLGALLDDLRTERVGALAGQARALHVERDGTLPAVVASPTAVHQILAVLTDNAVVHGAGTVTVRARDVAGALAVDVSDEGPGPVPAPDRPGGLGLRLARTLAESQGGRLVRTAAGRPTTYTLFLPGPGPDQGAGGV